MKPLTIGLLAVGCLLAGVAIGTRLPSLESATLAPKAVAEQARETLAIVDPLDRSLRWSALLAEADPGSLDALRDAVGAAPIEVGSPEVIAFAMWWADFDPRSALTWTQTEWRAQSRQVVASVVQTWAHREPEIAFEQASAVAQFYHDAAVDAAIVGWHASGKPGLVELVQSLPEGSFRQRVGEVLARRLVLGSGTEGAMQWAANLPNEAFRDEMTRRIASAASERGDPAAIAAWATPQVTTGDARGSGLPRRIATRWIVRDPEAAFAWLESLPAGYDRDDGVMESFRDWMRFSQADAVKWIQKTELERWSEPAFVIYARWMANSQERPEEALDLVARITDEGMRRRTTNVIVRKWAARDPKAAEAWLAKADVSDELRARAAKWLQKSG
jgi:hypothetical protein